MFKLTIMMVLCVFLADVFHGDAACCKDNFTVSQRRDRGSKYYWLSARLDKLRQKGQITPGDLSDDASPLSECSIRDLTGRHEGFILTGKIGILLQAETSCRMPLS